MANCAKNNIFIQDSFIFLLYIKNLANVVKNIVDVEMAYTCVNCHVFRSFGVVDGRVFNSNGYNVLI